jgi:mono/diheme cytochrome c family protein
MLVLCERYGSAALGVIPVVAGRYQITIVPRDPSLTTTTTSRAQLSQSTHMLTGTVAIDVDTAILAGTYVVKGRVSAKRMQLSGTNQTGAKLAWHGPLNADGTLGASGPVRMHTSGQRLLGTMTLALLGGTPTTTIIGVTTTTMGGPTTTTRFSTTTTTRLSTTTTTRAGGTTTTSANTTTTTTTTTTLAGGTTTTTLVVGSGNTFASACAICHNVDRSGLVGPDIRCSVSARITNAVRTGRGARMPSWPVSVMSDPALQAIITGLAASCPDTGASLYAGNCSTCHGTIGEGARNGNGVRGPNINCDSSGDFGSAVRSGEGSMPSFPTLTSAEINAMATYVTQFCGASTTTTTTTAPPTTTTTLPGQLVTFSGTIQPIFTASCATSLCHTGAFPAEGMDLSAGTAYAAVANVASLEIATLNRVTPGSPTTSYLYMKVTGAAGILGAQMPLPALPAAEIQAISSWISQGAPNN